MPDMMMTEDQAEAERALADALLLFLSDDGSNGLLAGLATDEPSAEPATDTER